MTILWSVAGFIIAMGVLVTIHEWGHFIVAKKFNVKVLTFSIGFGKVIWHKQLGETDYQLSMIPLGGFVKFLDERSGDIKPNEDYTRAFNRQSVFKRFVIVVAGPLVNLLFAWLVFSLIYIVGVPSVKPVFKAVLNDTALSKALPDNHIEWQIAAVNRQPVTSWKEVYQAMLLQKLAGHSSVVEIDLLPFGVNASENPHQKIYLSLKSFDINNPKQDWVSVLGFVPESPIVKPIIEKIFPDSVAEKAGFLEGDYLLSFNDIKLKSWLDFVKAVRSHPNEKVVIGFQRQGQIFQKTVLISTSTKSGEVLGEFGASVFLDKTLLKPYQIDISYPPLRALEMGFNHSKDLIVMSLEMIRKMVMGDVSPKNLSGPLSIADYSGQALSSGLLSFLSLLGLLSLSLGLLNLLPIPVLDGGHLTLYIIEMIRGVPLNEALEVFVQKIGFVIIIGLTVFAFFNDVVRISDG